MSDSKISAVTSKLLSNVSGSVEIRVNSADFGNLQINGTRLNFVVSDPDRIKGLIHLFPRKARKLSFLNRVSTLLKNIGLTVELSDKKGEIMLIGSEAHSIFGGVKIKILRIRKYL
jgi:hypothetical protein